MITALEEIGGEERLHDLVTAFYDRMETDPAAHSLHRLHFRGHGLNHIRQAQFEFMCGFLGGRAYYRERNGHMNPKVSLAMSVFTFWISPVSWLVACRAISPAA